MKMLNYCILKIIYIIGLTVVVVMLEEIQNGIRAVNSDRCIGRTVSGGSGFRSDDTDGDGGNRIAYVNDSISSRNVHRN
ncbi:hypothetical protein ILUMI_22968 [Ignelater luminosus]|uniref:Uncharacterized protein n=1 Tax=Ignelater luminosus TaxID=2038154 RepID=A0A8K0C9M3_IGNLU|nr:hypothetical protein ILUMI_22968 [Ignelater luminosus]